MSYSKFCSAADGGLLDTRLIDSYICTFPSILRNVVFSNHVLRSDKRQQNINPKSLRCSRVFREVSSELVVSHNGSSFAHDTVIC